MRASKSGSNDISEKSSAHSSTTMNEAATLPTRNGTKSCRN